MINSRGTMPVATIASSAALASKPLPATRSCRVVRTARKPPATMPAVPPSRYAVIAEVASTIGMESPTLRAVGRNVCNPTAAVV